MHILRHENDARFSDESAYSPTCARLTPLVTCQRRDILRHVVRIQPKLAFLWCQIALGDSFGWVGPDSLLAPTPTIRPIPTARDCRGIAAQETWESQRFRTRCLIGKAAEIAASKGQAEREGLPV